MSRFNLNSVGERLSFRVDQQSFSFEAVEHPHAPGEVHAAEGGKAFVFRVRELQAPHGDYAFKVLKSAHRDPSLVAVCARLDPLKGSAGFTVCRRLCLTPTSAADLIRQSPDLSFAILMPWIGGLSWFDALQKGRHGEALLNQDQCRQLAFNLVNILLQLEEEGNAHCDLSGPNVLFNPTTLQVELIDVEDFYMPGLQPPKAIPAGTPGYQHRTSATGQWNPLGDRFAGAVLLCEMLGWYDDEVRRQCSGESYFSAGELQQPTARQRLASLKTAVSRHGDQLGRLLEQAWNSSTLTDCPSFREWWAACSPFEFVELSRPPRIIWSPLSAAGSNPVVAWEPLSPQASTDAVVRWEGGSSGNDPQGGNS
jgi:serine/threonine protein kinase